MANLPDVCRRGVADRDLVQQAASVSVLLPRQRVSRNPAQKSNRHEANGRCTSVAQRSCERLEQAGAEHSRHGRDLLVQQRTRDLLLHPITLNRAGVTVNARHSLPYGGRSK